MPISEESLLLYVSYLFEEGLSASTIRVYLSAVRSLHVFAGEQYPTTLLRVKLALKGAVRNTPQPVRKLPITISILRKMLPLVKRRFDKVLMTAVFTLAFFGCLRLSEFCVSDNDKFDSKINLCLMDVTLDVKAKLLTLFLRRSKTDTENAGVYVYIGCSGDVLCCAFCAMRTYLVSRSTMVPDSDDSPLFLVPGGGVLTKSYSVSVIRLLLSMSGCDPALYSGHSFRAGTATSAGDCQFREWEVKMLGRWASTAYNVYLRNPKVTATFASRLVAPAASDKS